VKKNLSTISAIVCLSSILAACGGGGGNGPANSSAGPSSSTVATELEGTWIASTDDNTTGSACGLTSSGALGERFTVTFNMNRYTHKSESCVILIGNKGSYLLTDTASGTFSTGDIVLSSTDPTMQMRALDLISSTTAYTSYNLVSNKLRIALPFQTYDGSTREKRAFQIATFYDPASKTLIVNPTYIKQ
jgi:hypothetical protein